MEPTVDCAPACWTGLDLSLGEDWNTDVHGRVRTPEQVGTCSGVLYSTPHVEQGSVACPWHSTALWTWEGVMSEVKQ